MNARLRTMTRRKRSRHVGTIPVLELHVAQGGFRGHLAVLSEAGLSSADDDVEPHGRDGGCGADGCEREETLVGSTDANAC